MTPEQMRAKANLIKQSGDRTRSLVASDLWEIAAAVCEWQESRDSKAPPLTWSITGPGAATTPFRQEK
jgi:hypothetical protein